MFHFGLFFNKGSGLRYGEQLIGKQPKKGKIATEISNKTIYC